MSNLVKLFYKKHGRHPAGNVQDEVSAYAATEIERLQDEVERLQDHADQLAELGAQQTQKTIKAEQERDQLKDQLYKYGCEDTDVIRCLKTLAYEHNHSDVPRYKDLAKRTMDKYVERCTSVGSALAQHDAEVIEPMRAELERLRASVQAEKSVKETIIAQRNRAYEVNDAHLKKIAGLERERDQLKAELERYSMSAGAADQFRREALAMRQALGFDKYGDDIAPVDLLSALDRRDAEVINQARAYAASKACEYELAEHYDWALIEYAELLRQQAKEVKS